MQVTIAELQKLLDSSDDWKSIEEVAARVQENHRETRGGAKGVSRG